MKTPRLLTLALLAAAYLALGASAFGQTIRTLGYNTTNFTVVGFTNTNALAFTNTISISNLRAPVAVSSSPVTNSAPTAFSVARAGTETNTPSTNPVASFSGDLLESGAIILGVYSGDLAGETNEAGALFTVNNLGQAWFADKSTTRSNLFDSVGVSTNIQFVRVGGVTNTLIFSNGILHQVTTP